MLDLNEAAVVNWFTPIRPPSRQNSWPPAARQIERADRTKPLLEELGVVLSELERDSPASIPEAVLAPSVRQDLQTILAQLGAARLLRIVEWLALSQSQASPIITALAHGQTASARAISSSLRALTARAALTRMFSPDRTAALKTSLEAATNQQENA
jgi:hypothetical protein